MNETKVFTLRNSLKLVVVVVAFFGVAALAYSSRLENLERVEASTKALIALQKGVSDE